MSPVPYRTVPFAQRRVSARESERRGGGVYLGGFVSGSTAVL